MLRYDTKNLNACFNGCTVDMKTSTTAMSFAVVFSTFRIKLVENPCSSSFENINIYIFPIQIRQTQRCFLEKITKKLMAVVELLMSIVPAMYIRFTYFSVHNSCNHDLKI